MKAEVYKYLEDSIISIGAIESYVDDLNSVLDYQKDNETIDAVERRLAIIGEALFKAQKLAPLNKISEKEKIIKLRHILVHDYDLISHFAIWEIIQIHLPVLKLEVETIIQAYGSTEH